MFKQRLITIIVLLSIQIANGKELKEKYNEVTNKQSQFKQKNKKSNRKKQN